MTDRNLSSDRSESSANNFKDSFISQTKAVMGIIYFITLNLSLGFGSSPRRWMLDSGFTWSKDFPATSMPLTSRISSLTPSSPVLSASPPRTRRDMNTPGTYTWTKQRGKEQIKCDISLPLVLQPEILHEHIYDTYNSQHVQIFIITSAVPVQNLVR